MYLNDDFFCDLSSICSIGSFWDYIWAGWLSRSTTSSGAGLTPSGVVAGLPLISSIPSKSRILFIFYCLSCFSLASLSGLLYERTSDESVGINVYSSDSSVCSLRNSTFRPRTLAFLNALKNSFRFVSSNYSSETLGVIASRNRSKLQA